MMKALLRKGQYILGAKNQYRIGNLLGSGAQGEVYEASTLTGVYAIKWYFGHMATDEQYQGLQRLAKIGPPNDCFLWPIEVIRLASVKGFGYIMPLRPARFASIVDLMKRKVEPSFLTLITAAIAMVVSFSKLHQKRLCYRDIAFGNVFFDPKTGEILICDNDNIAFEGENHVTVLGTPRFMAPEIVRGEALPDVLTDRFSLSVLLFYMFMIHHPLEGKLEASIKCFDLPAMRQLYGDKPIFIFDPILSSNRPVAGLHDNAIVYWHLYPEHFKSVFVQAFTKGLKQRNSRPDETIWLQALVRLKNSLLHCSCGAENFYDHGAAQTSGSHKTCWACKKTLASPLRMRLNQEVIVLGDHVKLYAHHTIKGASVMAQQVIAEVARHPVQPGVKGLKNISPETWKVRRVDGLAVEVNQGRSITLEDGIEIDFGSVVGYVKA